MKDGTVSRRNFVGAFCGGVLGILAFGYIHPIALPFGCFFGVVIGWWYREIWQSVTESFRRSITRTQHVWDCNRFMTFMLSFTRRLKGVRFNIGPYMRFFHFCAFAFVWLLRQPIAFIQLLRAHPVNRACATRTLAVLTYLVLNALWVVPLVVFCVNATESAPKNSLMPALYAIGGCIFVPIMVLLAPFMYINDEDTPKMRRFYVVWERYAASGPFRFFVKDFVNFFLNEIGIFILVCGTLVWFTGIVGVFIVLVVVPISVMIGVIKGIYEVSTKAGHWLCFGTTVVVTALIAWMANPYLNDARILWAVALFAGLSSGIAVEGLRRSLDCFFSVGKRTQGIVSAALGTQLSPMFHTFWKITTNIGSIFIRPLTTPGR